MRRRRERPPRAHRAARALIAAHGKERSPAQKTLRTAWCPSELGWMQSSKNQFVVAAVASNDGQFSQDAPKALLEVPGMSAGETREVTLRLPAAAMKMGADGAAFTIAPSTRAPAAMT